MTLTFFDRQDELNPLNGRSIERKSELLDILNSLGSRPPFFVELEGTNGYGLMIGIGDPACVQYSHNNGDLPYLMAVGSHHEDSQIDAEYLMGGTATPVARQYNLPFDVAREIACHFQETGERSSSVSWEEI